MLSLTLKIFLNPTNNKSNNIETISDQSICYKIKVTKLCTNYICYQVLTSKTNRDYVRLLLNLIL